jgi:hypothetical protein
MWMEENLGERINVNRTREAVATGADQIAVGCPFCRVMLSDGLTSEQADGRAREEVEVLDVAQMLLASVKGESATRAPADAAVAPRSEETRAEPRAGDETQTTATVTETADVGPAAAASGGSSLFDLGSDDGPPAEEESVEAPAYRVDTEQARAAEPGGGSLFDLEGDEEAKAQTDEVTASATTTASESASSVEPTPSPAESTETTDPGGGSLFDLGPADEPETIPAAAEPETTPAAAEPEPAPPAEPVAPAAPTAEIPEGGSLFDLAAPEDTVSDDGGSPAPEADEAPASPEPEPDPEKQSRKDVDIDEGGSLFDL